jgi:preprotein translocase subunit SecE
VLIAGHAIIQLRAAKRTRPSALNLRSSVIIAMLILFIGKQNNADRFIVISIVGGYRMRITKFLPEVASEMRKVSWPKRKQLVRYTITVLTTVIIMALFFAVLDLGISELIRLILE